MSLLYSDVALPISNHSILKAKINTINNKIRNISDKIELDSIYKDKIKSITDNAMKNLDLWKNLESKYKTFRDTKNWKIEKRIYKQKVKIYRLEIQKSLSALMMISVNIKNLV